jgi:hypothetical protein
MTQLPDFEFKAIRSNRVVTPAALRGMPALLLFHNHLTLDAVRAVQEAVRRNHHRADQPFLASVVDLSSVPGLMRPMATSAMGIGYSQATALLPAGLDPADYVVILPDWNGRVTKAFDIANVSRQPALIFVDNAGRIRDRYQGDAPGEAAVRILEEHGVEPVTVPGFPQIDGNV